MRLTDLIQTWPSMFTDLNKARNFVGQWCFDNKFRYTGWPDVALHKYRLYVNFNAAKYALEDGVFEVERAVPDRKPVKKANGQERDNTLEQEDEVQTLEVQVPTSEHAGNTRTDRLQDVKTATMDGQDDGIQPVSHSSVTSPETTCSNGAPFTKALARLEKEEAAAAVDPFKVSLFATQVV